jgi:hypothetical protein
MNVYRLLRATPMPEGARLRLRRFFMDRELDRERRQIMKNGGSAADVWEGGNWSFEYDMLEEDEARFHTRSLLSRARELRIMRPPVYEGDALSADYRPSGLDGRRYYLSIEGEQKLRTAIREEEKYRSERWARRIPYITALSGLIGTATGLVAVFVKLGS